MHAHTHAHARTHTCTHHIAHITQHTSRANCTRCVMTNRRTPHRHTSATMPSHAYLHPQPCMHTGTSHVCIPTPPAICAYRHQPLLPVCCSPLTQYAVERFLEDSAVAHAILGGTEPGGTRANAMRAEFNEWNQTTTTSHYHQQLPPATTTLGLLRCLLSQAPYTALKIS
jgi:hypothetical protein